MSVVSKAAVKRSVEVASGNRSDVLKSVEELESEILTKGGGAIIFTPEGGFRLAFHFPKAKTNGVPRWLHSLIGLTYTASNDLTFLEAMARQGDLVSAAFGPISALGPIFAPPVFDSPKDED